MTNEAVIMGSHLGRTSFYPIATNYPHHLPADFLKHYEKPESLQRSSVDLRAG
jgi:hypothetical protein